MSEDILLRIIVALLLVITGLCWHIGDLQTERLGLRSEIEYWRQVYIKFVNEKLPP